MLPHLAEVRAQHECDVAAGAGWVALAGALGLQYPTRKRYGRRVSRSVRVVTRYDIRLLPTCSKPATTFALCRSSSATAA